MVTLEWSNMHQSHQDFHDLLSQVAGYGHGSKEFRLAFNRRARAPAHGEQQNLTNFCVALALLPFCFHVQHIVTPEKDRTATYH
jgi:hypothetical protein